jgi:CRP/FNR family transcriptional regulator, dissimilatory nitrate respiration regulator
MDYSLLSDSPFFKGITPDDIKIILDSLHFNVRKFQTTSIICQTGEPVTSLMILLSGTVRGEMIDYAGRIITIEDIPAPGALAPAFMFGNRNRFPVNVVAVTSGELLVIGKPDFLKLLMKNNILLVNFLDMISNRSQFLSEKIKFLNFKTIKGKLAFYILQKAGKEGMIVNLGMTQNGLADFFGVARPSVARALGDLEDDGYIEAKGKNVKIIDKEGLANMTVD